MEPEFITYQKFDDSALANELAAVLDKHQIKYLMEEESLTFDATFSFNPLSKLYAVKIKSDDFERVNLLLRKEEEKNTQDVEKDYYLLGFTNDELMEVVTKADEWSAFDVVLARKLLAEKGTNIDDKKLADIAEKRIEELRVPDKPQTLWIGIGYIFALFGGILGIFIGWYLANEKKTLPDGERVYEYNDNDRRHGRIIFFIGVLVFIIGLAYKFWEILK